MTIKNFVNSNNSNNTTSIKEVIKDTASVWGKCFLVGCSIVSTVALIKEAVKANEDYKKKYGV